MVGTTSNRDALGAKVTITVRRAIQYRENNGSMGHFLSQQLVPLHFGLGKATTANQVFVQWPSGKTQTFVDVPADQRMVITED